MEVVSYNTDYKELSKNKKIICNFMESQPELPSCWCGSEKSKEGWWMLIPTCGGGMEWISKQLTLDDLYKVEECLDNSQRNHYISHMASFEGLESKFYNDAWIFLHASLEQKITTLAIVLSYNV
jgi:hypothetical protein